MNSQKIIKKNISTVLCKKLNKKFCSQRQWSAHRSTVRRTLNQSANMQSATDVHEGHMQEKVSTGFEYRFCAL